MAGALTHGLLRDRCFPARILIVISECTPRFPLYTFPKKTSTHLFQNRTFCCFWKQSVPPSLPCDALLRLSSGAGACLEAGWCAQGAAPASAVPSPPSEPCVSSPAHCAAPHASWALSEAPAQLHLPALKGLRRGWENEFGMECRGKLKASAATVVCCLSFSETGAMHN